MEVRADGKVAIVTGAAQGVGRAVAVRLAQAGARALLLTDRQPLDDVVEAARGAGAEAAPLIADLAEASAPPRIARACLDTFGRIDLMVNAAAITDRARVLEAEGDIYDRLYAVNQRAPLLLMKHAMLAMQAQGGGAVVNILTMNIHGGSPPTALYASTKAALALLTKNAAHAHRHDRIRVNGIAVGWVDTPGERRMQFDTYGRDDAYFAAQAAERPFGRLLEPDDVARLTLFLLSDCAGPLTGAIIDQEQWVNGGRD